MFFKDPFVKREASGRRPPLLQMRLQACCVRRPRVLRALPPQHDLRSGPHAQLSHSSGFLLPALWVDVVWECLFWLRSYFCRNIVFHTLFPPIQINGAPSTQLTTSLVNKGLKHHRNKLKTCGFNSDVRGTPDIAGKENCS